MTCNRKSTWHTKRKDETGPSTPLPPDHPVNLILQAAGLGPKDEG